MQKQNRSVVRLVVSSLVGGILLMSMGCVAQVREARHQQPIFDAPKGTEIALVQIDVPDWVQERAPEGDDPAELLLPAIQTAFTGSQYRLIDRTGEGYHFAIGPQTEPTVLATASRVALVGQHYQYDRDNFAEAYGAPPFQWNLISGPTGFGIDTDTGEISWVPQSDGEVSVTIEAVNSAGQERHTFTVQVLDQDELEIAFNIPRAPSVSDSQQFVSEPPLNVPDSIDEPLVLGVHVVNWFDSRVDGGSAGTRRQVTADVVYSLWTRDGNENIETRRVRLTALPHQRMSTAPAMSPEWNFWLKNNWEQDRNFVPSFAPMAEDELFQSAAEINAKAFAYPYGAREVAYSSALVTDDGTEEGIELMGEEDWAGAYDSFAQALETHGETDGIHYNMGVAAELQGKDELAIEHFRKAVEINSTMMYRQRLDATAQRHELRRDLTGLLEERAAAAERRQREAAAAQAEAEAEAAAAEEEPEVDQDEEAP